MASALPASRRDLRGFLQLLEQRGQLRRITAPVDPDLELAAIADRVLAAGGPALLFENVIGSPMPVAINLMGTQERVPLVVLMKMRLPPTSSGVTARGELPRS